jgi:hypothetical protein
MPDFDPYGRELPQSQYRSYSNWGDITGEIPRPLKADPAVWGQQQIRDRQTDDYRGSYQSHMMDRLSNTDDTGYLDWIKRYLGGMMGNQNQHQRGVDFQQNNGYSPWG